MCRYICSEILFNETLKLSLEKQMDELLVVSQQSSQIDLCITSRLTIVRITKVEKEDFDKDYHNSLR